MNAELRSLFLTAIKSVRPSYLMKSLIRRDSDKLIIKDRFFTLNHNCYLIGFGKAVYEMAVEVERIVGDHLRRGIVSVPRGYQNIAALSAAVSVVEGAENNLPDANSFEAARRIKQLAEKCDENDVLLVLISGGGSALLSYPIVPISVAEKVTVIKLLTSAGADIVELNCVRKAMSELKGGKLALAASPSTVVSFVLSDIVGDPLDCIASGPTVLPYACSSQKALSVLAKYRLLNRIPESVSNVLHSDDDKYYLSKASALRPNAHNIIIGNNSTSLSALKEQISRSHRPSVILTNRIASSVAQVCEVYAKLIERTCRYLLDQAEDNFLDGIRQIENQYSSAYVKDVVENLTHYVKKTKLSCRRNEPLFFICGGEPTVQVRGNGKGGRNQELSLRMAIALHELNKRCDWINNKFNVYFMSGGTDGIDGPTDAAGAIVDSNSIDEALNEGLNPATFLDNNDSYSFFSKFDRGSHLIKTGHTGTNVMDVHLIVFTLR